MKFFFPVSAKKFFLFILLIAFLFFTLKFFLFRQISTSDTAYYAVFLTNGQVYFGHIQKLNDQVLLLENVYYLRANTNLQNTQTQDQKQETNVELSLIKLGNELHGPKDMMTINRINILFWEELRNDGRVVQAINRYQP